jgi:hypothetical protein
LEVQRGKQDYHESLIAEADDANAQMAEHLEQLSTILICALDRDPSVNFERFLKFPTEGDLDSDETLRLISEPQRESYLPIKPSFIARLI